MKSAQEYAELAAASVDKALYPGRYGSKLTQEQRELFINAANVYIQLAQYQWKEEAWS